MAGEAAVGLPNLEAEGPTEVTEWPTSESPVEDINGG